MAPFAAPSPADIRASGSRRARVTQYPPVSKRRADISNVGGYWVARTRAPSRKRDGVPGRAMTPQSSAAHSSFAFRRRDFGNDGFDRGRGIARLQDRPADHE